MKYPVRYSIQRREPPDGWTKDELGVDGGADALVIMSIVRSPTLGVLVGRPATSQAVLSVDGETGERLADVDLFQAWVAMARGLMDLENLSDEAQMICRRAFEAVQAQILAERLGETVSGTVKLSVKDGKIRLDS
jgi:hypothetical protein